MKNAAVMSLLILTVIFSSCKQSKRAIETTMSKQLSGNFKVITIDEEKLSNDFPTLIFSETDNSVSGTTTCNSFFGSYSINQNTISFTELAVSEMYCADPQIMKTEQGFLNALKNADTFALENNILTLFSKTTKEIVLTATKETK